MEANPTAKFIKDRLGGAEVAAERVKRSPSAVRMWAHRRAIPRSHWPELLDAYETLTMDDLRALETTQGAV